MFLMGYLNVKVGREDIFKQTVLNESPDGISNNIVVRVLNFATSKNLVVKSTVFARDFHKYTWTSPEGKRHNQTDHFLTDRRLHSSILDA
jgi:hypothetical protein